MKSQFERSRNWPPDYVSAETLAYRLDCPRGTIGTYVKLGFLPGPQMIGNLERWDFAAVRIFIAEKNFAADSLGLQRETDNEDVYMKGIRDGAAAKG